MSRIHAALRKAEVREDAPFILDPPPPSKLVLVKPPAQPKEEVQAREEVSAPEPSESGTGLSGIFRRLSSALSR